MKAYLPNSPEAQARLLALMMITDTRVADAEIDALEGLGVFRLLGLPRRAFAEVLSDYCADLRRHSAPGGRILLVDRERIDAIVAAVDDPERRLVVARLMLALAKADGDVCDGEGTVLRYVLRCWGIALEELALEPA